MDNVLSALAAAFHTSGTATFIQGGGASSASAANVHYTFPSANTAGNLVFVFAAIFGSAALAGSTVCSDAAGNTYTLINDSQGASTSTETCEIAVFYAWSIAAHGAGNVVTVSNGGGPLDYNVEVAEWSGIQSSSDPLDVWAGGERSYQAGTDSQILFQGGLGYPLGPNATDLILLGACNNQNAQFAREIGAGPWTTRHSTTNANGEWSLMADRMGHAGDALLITVAAPVPTFPQGGPTGQPVTLIQEAYWNSVNGLGAGVGFNIQPFDALCGPFEFRDSPNNRTNLYAALGGGYNALNMFKSVDEGLTWSLAGGAGTVAGAFAANEIPVLCQTLGSKIYVLYPYATGPPSAIVVQGLRISAFDTSTDTWTSATATSPNSNLNDTPIAYGFAVLADGSYMLVWDDIKTNIGGTRDVSINLCAGGSWNTKGTVRTNGVLNGITWDRDDQTLRVTCYDWVSRTTVSAATLRLFEITNFTWPFVPPAAQTVTTSWVTTPAPSNPAYPSIGRIAKYRGNLYLPYSRNNQVPACYYQAGSGWATTDLTPALNPDHMDSSGTSMWALVIGADLYIFWSGSYRLRYLVSTDGNVANQTTITLYDPNLNPPPEYLGTVHPLETFVIMGVFNPSLNILFGSRLGVIATLQDYEDNQFQAYFFPWIGGAPESRLGNRFY